MASRFTQEKLFDFRRIYSQSLHSLLTSAQRQRRGGFSRESPPTSLFTPAEVRASRQLAVFPPQRVYATHSSSCKTQ